MKVENFGEYLNQLALQKGISKETVVKALENALRKAYIQYTQGESDQQARIEVTDDTLDFFVVKEVIEPVAVPELEISLADAKKYNKKAKIGDTVDIPVDIKDLQNIFARNAMQLFHQELVEVDKQVLFDLYKEKLGEIITGEVESCDRHGASVRLGNSSIYIRRDDLIGREEFEQGDQIRMYVAEASEAKDNKAPALKVTRSNPGFLKVLFEEEVADVRDGTVLIKDVARTAGIRAKVAVYSKDSNVDPVGSCIGVNGICIKRIVEQLGGKEKEKLDIIPYTTNEALYIANALRPAKVVSVALKGEDEKGNKKAVAIVENDSLSLAIGKQGTNTKLASRLTGWSIDVHEQHDLDEGLEDLQGLEFRSVGELEAEEQAKAKQRNYNAYVEQVKKEAEAEAVRIEAGYNYEKPHQITDDDLIDEVKPVEEKPVETAPVVEEVKVEEPVKPTYVRTTTTLESLEAALEDEKKKEFKPTHKTSKRPHNITDEEQPNEEKVVTPVAPAQPKLEIYSKEELEAIEAEEYDDNIDEVEEDDVDYDEYDSYYDDEN